MRPVREFYSEEELLGSIAFTEEGLLLLLAQKSSAPTASNLTNNQVNYLSKVIFLGIVIIYLVYDLIQLLAFKDHPF